MVAQSNLRQLSHPPSQLIAITLGLAPHAEPLVCGDLTGPNSLFGEEIAVPRPLGSMNDFGRHAFSSAATSSLYSSAVLWDAAHPKASSLFAVRSTTFLTGTATSTFDVARNLLQLGCFPDWASVISTRQKQGCGQLQRSWYSPMGNLHVSVKMPQDPLFATSACAIVVGILVVKALQLMKFDVSLKWPNDILLASSKKVAGILIKEQDGEVLAGIGINLSNVPTASELRKGYATPPGVLLPVSDDASTHAPFFFWQRLVAHMMQVYELHIKGCSLKTILEEGQTSLVWLGKNVIIHDEGTVVAQGRCLGFAPDGGLSLRSLDNVKHTITNGSVSLSY